MSSRSSFSSIGPKPMRVHHGFCLFFGIFGVYLLFLPACTPEEISETQIVNVYPFAEDAKNTVENVSISYHPEDTSYILRWQAHSSEKVSAYRIARNGPRAISNLSASRISRILSSEKSGGNLSYDAEGIPTRWFTSRNTQFLDLPAEAGTFSYVVHAVFPDGSMSIPSTAVSIINQQQSEKPPPFSAPEPPANTDNGGDPEPCIPIESFFVDIPDLICLDIDFFVTPGTDDTLDSAVIPDAHLLLAVTRTTDLRPFPPLEFRRWVFAVNFSKGPDESFGTADDGIIEMIDSSDFAGATQGTVYTYTTTEPAQTCIKLDTDLAHYDHFEPPESGQNRQIRYAGPGPDEQWETHDDDIGLWFLNTIWNSKTTSQILHTLPGNDLVWLTGDDFQKNRTTHFFDAGNRLTQTVLFDVPGAAQQFGAPGDVSSSVSYYSYNLTGNLINSRHYTLPGHLPLTAEYLEYPVNITTEATIRTVTAGTDGIFGTSNDVVISLTRTQQTTCPAATP